MGFPPTLTGKFFTERTVKRKYAKRMSPSNANTFEKVCRLRTDNFDAGDFWIILDGGNDVVLTAQKSGKPSTATIAIPRKNFRQIARWFLRLQATPRADRKDSNDSIPR